MKTVVITGSARGFGYAMLEDFYKKDYNVVICDVNDKLLSEAKQKLKKAYKGKGKILSYVCDVTKTKDIESLIKNTLNETNSIDIWINNAGVNQDNLPIWEVDPEMTNRLIDIDLKGTINCSTLINKYMIKQGYGQIYNVEGHGSNDNYIKGLSIYGTAKRAVTYFTESLQFENNKEKTGIIIGKITPGIMITNFITKSLGDGKEIELDAKTKNIYNILGDYPETIAKYMVDRIDKNTYPEPQFTWLSTTRSMGKFIKSVFKKNNYFENKEK